MSCFLCNAAVAVAAITAIMYIGCRLRAFPVKVMRGWFIAVVIVNVLVMAGLSFVFDKLRLLGVPFSTTKAINSLVCRATFGAIVVFNPHIRMHMDDESWRTWCNVPGKSCILLNHTSFWDTFAFVGTSPWSYIYNAKTLMKDSLKKLPIFGSIFDRVGHFPVYFKTEEDGNFSVDKERQAPVLEAVKKHLDDGGRICLFPEGAVNKNPAQLLGFRRGTFSTVIDNRLALYYFVTVGNDVTWPASAAVGGLPADIVLSCHKYEVDYNKVDAVSLSEDLQKVMQAQLEANIKRRNAIVGAAGGKKSD